MVDLLLGNHELMCGELMAAKSIKPSKFKRHLETKHSKDKDNFIQSILLFSQTSCS